MLPLSLLAGCSPAADSGSYAPDIEPTAFSSTVDNVWLPLPVGAVWTWIETSDEGAPIDITVSVSGDTREVMGVDCLVVHDVASDAGVTVEDTYDWYAQREDGDVWYFGEDTTSYDGAETSTEGSWEGGVDGAEPGIVMKAAPQVGDTYRQEYLPGHAEDQAEVIAVDATASVPAGDYVGCVQTRETTPLEPDLIEEKTYASGVGAVLEETTAGGSDHAELQTITGG